MEERRVRVGSLFEWLIAAFGVVALAWLLSVPVQRLTGPRVEAAPDAPASLPPGVPAGATNIPVILLLDGRELRHGELHARLVELLPDALTERPILRSAGEFGERHTRTYVVDGTRFFVVCERVEAGGPMRVSGIYIE